MSTVLPFYMPLLLRRLLEHVHTISHRENKRKRKTASMYAHHSFDIYTDRMYKLRRILNVYYRMMNKLHMIT